MMPIPTPLCKSSITSSFLLGNLDCFNLLTLDISASASYSCGDCVFSSSFLFNFLFMLCLLHHRCPLIWPLPGFNLGFQEGLLWQNNQQLLR